MEWTGHAKDPSRSNPSAGALSRMTNDIALGAIVVREALCASWPPVSVVECDG